MSLTALIAVLIIVFAVTLLFVLCNFIAKIVTIKRVEVTDKSIDECIEVIIELKAEIDDLKQEISVQNEKIDKFDELFSARRDSVDKQLEYFADDLNQLAIELMEQGSQEHVLQPHAQNPSDIESLLIEKGSLIASVDNLKRQLDDLQEVTDEKQRNALKNELRSQMQKVKEVVREYQQRKQKILKNIPNENG